MRRKIISILAIVAFIILIYNIVEPTHLHARHEMEYCGGCHTEESTIRMHEIANPLEKECIECHEGAMSGLSLHADMVPSECDRCHEFGNKPTYTDCNLCHDQHYHVKSGIKTGDRPCIECHTSHSTLTDNGCSLCHPEAYNNLKTKGDLHSELTDSCYTCHTEHKLIPSCFDVGCHVDMYHGKGILTNCTQCHQPHVPKQSSFSSEVSQEDCGNCHPQIIQHFQATPSNHSELACVECHIEHLSVGSCMDCHADVHPGLSGLDVEQCEACHGDPHFPSKYGL